LPQLVHQLQIGCWPVFFYPRYFVVFQPKKNWEIFCFCCVNVFFWKSSPNFWYRELKKHPLLLTTEFTQLNNKTNKNYQL
jgi:hypothetical protein